MKWKQKHGFTVIEFLTVLVVIGIIVGMLMSTGAFAMRKMGRQRAKAEIAALEAALDAYKQDQGFYPAGSGAAGSSGILYQALMGAGKKYIPNGHIPVVGGLLLDPFGSEYRYQSPGRYNQLSFDLWSFGPDEISGTPDDIANFKTD